ncbi:MAG: hypothetical protein ABI131_04295, partial [Nostocoides sp.]
MARSALPFVCGRRAALLAAGVVGIGGLAACSSGGTSGEGEPVGQGGGGGGAGGADLAKTTDIPVGGGKIFAGAGVILTQPTAGEFKAFS